MDERLHKSLIRSDSDPLLPSLLLYRLCRALSVDGRDGAALISLVNEQLHGLQQRSEGYLDIGLSLETPAIIVRLIALEPDAWVPAADAADGRPTVWSEVVEDRLLRIVLPVDSIDARPSGDTLNQWRIALEELAERWRNRSRPDQERLREVMERSEWDPSDGARTIAGLLEELDRQAQQYQTTRETRRKDGQETSADDDEPPSSPRHLRDGLSMPLTTIDDLLEQLRATDLSVEQREYLEQLGHTAERVVQLLTGSGDEEEEDDGQIPPVDGTTSRSGEPADAGTTDGHEAIDPAEESPPVDLSLEGKRVLVATDDSTTLYTLEDVLEAMGATVHTVDRLRADDGHVRLFPEEQPEYDAIFLDPHMCGLNGFELLETLNRDHSMDCVVPVASTVFEKKNRHHAASYGIQYFLSKPVTGQEVQDVVRSLLDLTPVGGDEATGRETTTDPLGSIETPVQLLLAEDNDLNRDFMRRLLEAHPIEITSAADGQEALETYREQADAFDVIFMDLKMPELNGIEATRAIRKEEEQASHPHTPIVALTAETRSDRVDQSLSAGCDAHVSKPVDVNRVLEVIRGQLEG